MPTAAQRDAVRYDLSTTVSDMPDVEIDGLYVRAEGAYPNLSDVQEAWVRWRAVRSLKVAAAKRVDYRQNQSSENLSQIFPQLERLEQDFLADLNLALNAAYTLVRFGGLRRSVPRFVAYPDDFDPPNLPPDHDVSRLDT